MAAKMANIVGDVTGLNQRHHPWNIPHLDDKNKGFPLKAKSFRNTATYPKLGRGGGPQLPFLRVRPGVERNSFVLKWGGRKEFFCFKMKACRERAFTFSIKILWRVTCHCSRLSAIVRSDKSVCFYCIDIQGENSVIIWENRLHDHHWTIFVVLAGDPYPLRMKIDCFLWYIKSFHRESKINYYTCTTNS